MTLIYTALLSEAQAIIEKYKLQKTNSNPKIYCNSDFLVLVGGIGKVNTIKSLSYIFENYTINKAINIGIAGCGDKTIKIGELFCTNKILEEINYKELITVDQPIASMLNIEHSTLLYDMEGRYFLDFSSKYLDQDYIYIFKIVSDHLDDTIPSKDFVKKLIRDSLKKG